MPPKLNDEGLTRAEAELLYTIRSAEEPTIIHRYHWPLAKALRGKRKITLSKPCAPYHGGRPMFRRALPVDSAQVEFRR